MSKLYRNKYDTSKKNEKTKFRIIYIFIIVLLTFIICFTLYMISAKSDKLKDNLNFNTSSKISETTAITTEATTTVALKPVLANPVPENEGVDISYFDSCAFVGDSITTGLSGYGFIPEKNVIAGTGMNIDKIDKSTVSTAQGDMSILDALKSANPKNVYIMLGSNGIAWLSNEKMVEEYETFIDKIKAELPSVVKIYILSIPPVTVNKETLATGAIQNTAIDSYNSALLKMANDKKLYFVDINTALKGNDGKLPIESAGKDGMHFKKDTYQIMINYILKHTVKEQ